VRVVCHTVEAFVENLRIGTLVEKTVWIDVSSKQAAEHKIAWNLQASAVVRLADGGEFLLQYGEDCGYDYTDGEPELEGTQAVKHRRGYLVEQCEDMGLTVRPGLVSE